MASPALTNEPLWGREKTVLGFGIWDISMHEKKWVGTSALWAVV